MRVAIRFGYDGRFSGYARQPERDTVEDLVIEAARGEGYVDGSWRTGSRTDKGVCAVMNVARLELDRPHLEGFVPAMQSRLPDGIWMHGVAPVDDTWDPRKASSRTYAYHAPKRDERLAKISAACMAFVGTHDVSAFARVEPHRDPQRTVMSFDVRDEGDWWVLRIRGQSFLWNQVRRSVAAALAVGAGTLDVADIHGALRSGEGDFGIAPAEGLLLEKVEYADELAWADAGEIPRKRWTAAAQVNRIHAALLDGVRP